MEEVSRSKSATLPPPEVVVFSSSIVPDELLEEEGDDDEDELESDDDDDEEPDEEPDDEREEEALHLDEDCLFFKLDLGLKAASLTARACARWSRVAWRDLAGAETRLSFLTRLSLPSARMRRGESTTPPLPLCWPAARVEEVKDATDAIAAMRVEVRMLGVV